MKNYKQSRREFIIQGIQGKIEAGALAVGQKLPTIEALSQQYETSSITVRTALQDLIARGYLDSRRGSGYFVRRPPTLDKHFQKRVIGLLVESTEHMLSARIISGVEAACREKGFSLVLAQSHLDLALEAKQLRDLSAIAEGLLVIPTRSNANFMAFAALFEKNIPLVFIDRGVNNLNVPLVATDNEKGGYLATSHLLDLGLREIYVCYYGKIDEITAVADRVYGYQQALKERGIPYRPELICHMGAPYNLTAELLAGRTSKAPFGLFAINEHTAQGCYIAIKEAGLKIPDDVAVIGYDDFFSHYLDPPMTTIRQDWLTIGRRSVEILQDRMFQVRSDTRLAVARRGPQNVFHAPELLVRNSTSPDSDFCIKAHMLASTSPEMMTSPQMIDTELALR